MLYVLPLLAAMLCGCCTSPAIRTVQDFAERGLYAHRDGTLLECVSDQWVIELNPKGRLD